MAWPKIEIRPPRLSREGAELVVLGMISGGVIWLVGKIIDKGGDGYDLAAFLLVLQAIIVAIKDRWTQRTTDNAMAIAGASQPAPVNDNALNGAKPAGTEADPVHVDPTPAPDKQQIG